MKEICHRNEIPGTFKILNENLKSHVKSFKDQSVTFLGIIKKIKTTIQDSISIYGRRKKSFTFIVSQEQGSFNSGQLTLKNGNDPERGDGGWKGWRKGKLFSICNI